MDIFLSWSGYRSKILAQALRDWLPLTLSGVTPWLSSYDIDKGGRWSSEVAKQLEKSSVGIICLTPENLDAAWILFEAGALSKAHSDSYVCTYLYEVKPNDLTAPLNIFQATTATREDTRQLLSTINNRLVTVTPHTSDAFNRIFEKWWPDLEANLNKLKLLTDYPVDVEVGRASLLRSLNRLCSYDILHENNYFRKLITDVLLHYKLRLDDIAHHPAVFRLPHVLYPQCLISLLRAFKATVKAVALVDREEYFWRGKQGDEILTYTPEESTRVFVFRSVEHMRDNLSLLRKHSSKYNVGVLSYDNFSRQFPDYTYDFSVIGDISTRLLARYEDTEAPKLIRFSTDAKEISEHEDVLGNMINAAIPVDSSADDEKLLKWTFAKTNLSGLTWTEKRQVEMSAYIPIHDYDLHEEAHAYYVDMMQLMISIIEKNRNSDRKIRILELGSGTGIFTKRLAEIKNAELVAVEIDWACYKALEHKMESLVNNNSTTVTCLNKDSRIYNPDGEFDFICSSFADHHIKPYDKKQYFENIKNNLVNGGMFITGDEFLPIYDYQDVESRRAALKAYHGHIIEIAKQANELELVKLEEAALKSGLEERGDFKLSCQEYETMLNNAGFKYIDSIKIGPLDREDLGGVFVYQMRLQK